MELRRLFRFRPLAGRGVEISEELVDRVNLQILLDQLRAAHVAHDTSNPIEFRNRRRMQKTPQKRPWR